MPIRGRFLSLIMGNSASSVEALPPHQQGPALHDGAPQPAKRQPQKLSKPRVGGTNVASNRPRRMSNVPASAASSTTQLPVNPNPALRRQSTIASPAPVSPLPPSCPSLRTSPPTVAPSDTESPTKHHVSPEDERRLSLFRSKSSQEDRRSRRKSNGPVPAMPGERRSRANSMNWESEANIEYARRQVESDATLGRRQSVNYDLSSYEASRLLNQHGPAQPVEDESTLPGYRDGDESSAVWNSPGAAEEPEGLKRVDSNVSLYAPVRRRSVIQTPGLATRRAGGDNDYSRRSSLRHSNPPTPKMTTRARQDSLDSGAAAARIMSLPPPPKLSNAEAFQHVETPSDGEYKQLGAMAFGSLRITNGTASPIPSVDGERQLGGAAAQPSVTHDEADDFARFSMDTAEVEFVVEVGRVENISAPLTPRLVEVGALSRSSSIGRGLKSDPAALAHPEMPLPHDSWSKLKAMEARQSAEAGKQPEYSTNETLDIREDEYAKPRFERPSAEPIQQKACALVRADSGVVATPMSDDSLKPLSKADSGYGSGVSVRSLSSRKVAAKDDQLSRKSSDKSSKDATSPKAISNDATDSTPVAPFLDAATFDRLSRPASASNRPSLSPISPRTQGLPLSPGLDQRPVAPAAPERRRSSLWLTGSSFSTPRLSRPASTLSIGGEPNKPKKNKLQRLLSGASLRGGPPSVHITHSVEESIPGVPQDVEARLQEHSGRFPTASKRLALQKQQSQDTLRTIMSVGSVETPGANSVRNSLVMLDESLGAAPVAEPESARPQRRRTIHQSAVGIISRTSLRRKPVGSNGRPDQLRAQQGDLIPNGFESHITSIDSIRSSVGKSAFDSAFATKPEPDQQEDAYRRRSMSMDARTERDMEMRRQSSSGRSRLATTPSRASPIPELPEMSPTMFKSKTPPPISLQNRSARSIRKHPSSRTNSTPPSSRSLSRKSSRESVQSSRTMTEATDVPPVPAIDSRFPEFEHLRRDDRPDLRARHTDQTGPSRPSSSGSSMSNDPRAQRPSSAAPNLLRKERPQDLRRQSSFEDYSRSKHYPSGSRQARQYYEPQQQQAGSGSYYENQLRQLQDRQWGGEGWDEPSRYPPHGPAARHSYRAAPGSRTRGYEPPYRVLHSYNSPAYRNAPIWG